LHAQGATGNRGQVVRLPWVLACEESTDLRSLSWLGSDRNGGLDGAHPPQVQAEGRNTPDDQVV
ncbi:hypothetical protein, partial [Gemmata sp.]|uniref:hypothetical protein n=1 Tax=Gemmata sp. TaxID=1914242 RepID=UPI003F6F0702